MTKFPVILFEHEYKIPKRTITPHKGGRTICKSTNVTPETNELIKHLCKYGISLGDLVEWAAEDQAGSSTRAMEIEQAWINWGYAKSELLGIS